MILITSKLDCQLKKLAVYTHIPALNARFAPLGALG